jgi:hypothetical protein
VRRRAGEPGLRRRTDRRAGDADDLDQADNRFSGLRLRYVGASDEEVTDRHGGPVLVRWFRTPGGNRPTGRAWSDDAPDARVRMSYYSGLAEVEASGELMSVDHEGRTTFGHGDLTGLALLGRVPCA